MAGVIGGIAALIGAILWICFLAQTVMAIAEPSTPKLLAWIVAIPLVFAVEAACLWLVDRSHSYG